MVKEQAPAPLLSLYSYSSSSTSAPVAAQTTASTVLSMHSIRSTVTNSAETDFEGVVDLLRMSMQLVPHKRLPLEILLQFRMFQKEKLPSEKSRELASVSQLFCSLHFCAFLCASFFYYSLFLIFVF